MTILTSEKVSILTNLWLQLFKIDYILKNLATNYFRNKPQTPHPQGKILNVMDQHPLVTAVPLTRQMNTLPV